MLVLACLLSACGGGGGGDSSPIVQVVAQSRPVVFLGDSITAFWDVAGCIPGGLNGGIAGDRTDQMQARYPDHIAPLHASLLILLGGTNDINQQPSPTLDSLYAIAAAARNEGSTVILATIPPWSRADSLSSEARVLVWNAAVQVMATTYHFALVDYHAALLKPDGTADLGLFNPDGVHPNLAGYAVMCSALKATLNTLP